MRPIKCSQHKEIFEVNEQGQKQWIENWKTYLYLGYKKVKDDVDVINLEDLKAYPVGKTKVVKTVTRIEEGEEPRELFYPDEPSVTIRKISILGTCLPGCESMMKDLGFTHAYGNRYGWPDYDEVERLGMKVFVNIHDDITENGIREIVNQWKDRPGCGGYWCDHFGHEPDITNPPMEERKRFYDTVRKYDPDMQNHPVMEMMNNTSFYDFPDGQYPGWEKAFSNETHDLLLFDCYPGMDENAIKGMENTWKKFIKIFPKKHQVIPQMQAFNFEKGGIWRQYNFWKEKMVSAEFNNPYKGQIAVCYYDDASIRKNEELQQEIKQVNKARKETI